MVQFRDGTLQLENDVDFLGMYGHYLWVARKLSPKLRRTAVVRCQLVQSSITCSKEGIPSTVMRLTERQVPTSLGGREVGDASGGRLSCRLGSWLSLVDEDNAVVIAAAGIAVVAAAGITVVAAAGITVVAAGCRRLSGIRMQNVLLRELGQDVGRELRGG